MIPKVSIIVPVYNAEAYLSPCLWQLVNQTLAAIEIIIIDDRSTDNSFQIMQSFYQEFKEKVILLQTDEKKGPGGARNLGLLQAAGEYAGFVDSDDLADITMFEKLYQKAKEMNYDIVDTGFFNEKNDQAIIYTSDLLTGILNNEQRKELIVSGGYVWSKLFRLDFLRQHDAKFRERVILEDADFLTYLFASAKSMGNVKEILYKYSDIGSSASRIMEPNGYLHNIKQAIEAITQRLSSLPNYNEIAEAVEYEILQMYLNGIVICLLNKDTAAFHPDKELEELRELKSQAVRGGYHSKYVQNKFNRNDIDLMKKNDRSAKELLLNYS